MNVRKLSNLNTRDTLETYLIDAESEGFSFIELQMVARSAYVELVMGLDQVILIESAGVGPQGSLKTSTRIISDGALQFFPDEKSRCWGYLLATQKNKTWLAGQLSNPLVIPTDNDVKKEIYALAEKLGYATDKVLRSDKSIDKYLIESEDRSSEITKDNKIDELQAELAAIKAEKVVLVEKVKKPLAGRSVKQRNASK